jgi:ATP synthase protein I
MRKTKNPNENPWRAMALVGAVGIDFAFCTFGGFWIGRQISNWTNGHQLWILFGLLLGMSAGVVSVIYLIKQFTGEPHE